MTALPIILPLLAVMLVLVGLDRWLKRSYRKRAKKRFNRAMKQSQK